MHIQDAFEEYLFSRMSALCANGVAPVAGEASRMMDELGLTDAVTPFERILSALGPGIASPPRVEESAPESLRISIEHRYSLSRWPSFEFVVLESERGIAWGQTFARRTGTPVPAIHSVTDLARWSHVESEVLAALGAPVFQEDWFPWGSSMHDDGTDRFSLCYVYGLLQSIQPVSK